MLTEQGADTFQRVWKTLVDDCEKRGLEVPEHVTDYLSRWDEIPTSDDRSADHRVCWPGRADIAFTFAHHAREWIGC